MYQNLKKKTKFYNRMNIFSKFDKNTLFNALKFIGAGVGVVALIALFVFIFIPREYDVSVVEKTWSRTINLEELRTVEESDWSVPSGGRTLYTQQEIHHHDNVLDHYETKTKTESYQVISGYETHSSYSNNGNGTFTEHSYKTPIYSTEYRTVTYEEPVYKSVPVYKTKYYYEIDKPKQL